MATPLYRVQKTTSIYKNRGIHFVVDDLKFKSGNVLRREVIEHPGSSVILPILEGKKVVLIRQMRHATGGYLWELPAGTRSGKETFLTCARRELTEETGYKAGKWRKLLSFYPSPGILSERMHLYLAMSLTLGDASPEEDEWIKVSEFPIKEVLKMIRVGKIQDAKTILAIHYFINEVE